jgi:hypothetical protein
VNRLTTLFIPPLAMAVMLAVLALSGIGDENVRAWHWCLAGVVVLLVGGIVAALLNVAVFAPVYWLLGRLHGRKTENRTTDEHET